MPLFSKKLTRVPENISVDMHSHLLPGLDDGAAVIEDSVEMIRELGALGYKKFITTPHVMSDFYRNTPENIEAARAELNRKLAELALPYTVEAAAEYYMDEGLIEKMDNEEHLLGFGDNYLLVETSYINRPAFFQDALFKIKSLGYRPVLAHPERYTYLYDDFSLYKEIYDMGVYFQVNLNALGGYYGKGAKTYAEKLISHNMVDMVGTDCHKMKHIEALKKTMKKKHFSKLASLNLLNNTL